MWQAAVRGLCGIYSLRSLEMNVLPFTHEQLDCQRPENSTLVLALSIAGKRGRPSPQISVSLGSSSSSAGGESDLRPGACC